MQVQDDENELNFIDFNQDHSCISVGTSSGYKVFNCNPFGKCFGKLEGGIGIVEMLFCTSLVVLVGAGDQPALSPRRLQVINTKRRSTICELSFDTAILNVKLNRKRMAVVQENMIHLYDLSNLKLLHQLDTPRNPRGLVALAPSSENCYLAYPAGDSTGDVLVFDALNVTPVNIIPAHRSPASALCFSYDGSMLASASEKGTVIRVHGVPKPNKLFEFRRGTYAAKIYALAFDSLGTMLAVSSDTATVHLYKLNEVRDGGGSAVSSFLPSFVGSMWDPERDFAHIKLRKAGIPNLCGLDTERGHALVVTAEGWLYQYAIAPTGGECLLEQQYFLLENDDELADDNAAPSTSGGEGAFLIDEQDGFKK